MRLISLISLFSLAICAPTAGFDNNWKVKITGFKDKNGCLTVTSIKDTGSNVNALPKIKCPPGGYQCKYGNVSSTITGEDRETGDFLYHADNNYQFAQGDDAGNKVFDHIQTSRGGNVTIDARGDYTIPGCTFDVDSKEAVTDLEGWLLDRLCIQNFIKGQLKGNRLIPGVSPDLAYLRTETDQHTRACLLVNYCKQSGYGLVERRNLTTVPTSAPTSAPALTSVPTSVLTPTTAPAPTTAPKTAPTTADEASGSFRVEYTYLPWFMILAIAWHVWQF